MTKTPVPKQVTVLSDNIIDDISIVTNSSNGITLKQDDDIIWVSDYQLEQLIEALNSKTVKAYKAVERIVI